MEMHTKRARAWPELHHVWLTSHDLDSSSHASRAGAGAAVIRDDVVNSNESGKQLICHTPIQATTVPGVGADC